MAAPEKMCFGGMLLQRPIKVARAVSMLNAAHVQLLRTRRRETSLVPPCSFEVMRKPETELTAHGGADRFYIKVR